jgi:hypothetical protein
MGLLQHSPQAGLFNLESNGPALAGTLLAGNQFVQAIRLGAGLTLTGDTLSATSAPAPAAWGTITGTLSAQTDLQTALNAKADTTALANYVPTTRILTAGTGLTGGGDLSANRSFAFDTTWGDARYALASHGHTYVTSFNSRTGAVSLTSGDVTSALGFTPPPNTRTLTAGTGITGGGDLSANRSFAFDTTWGDARYALSGHTHPYLPLAGGTMTGSMYFNANLQLIFNGYGSLLKPLAERFEIFPVGDIYANSSFWRGVHFASPTLTVGGSPSFPRLSLYWGSTSLTDPTDGSFSFEIGNAGAIDVGMRLITQRTGYFDFRLGGTAAAILGTTAGNGLWRARFAGVSSNNENQLLLRERRQENGTDWTTTATLLQRRIDSSEQAFFGWGRVPGTSFHESLLFGHGASVFAHMSSDGRWFWSNNQWHGSLLDSANRFYFATSGATYISAPGEIILRPIAAGDDMFRFANQGWLYMRSINPTLWWHDTDNRCFGIHVNSDLAYFMRGGVNDPNWTQITDRYGVARWPGIMRLDNGNWEIGNDLRTGGKFFGRHAGNGLAAVILSTDGPSGGADGDLWLRY